MTLDFCIAPAWHSEDMQGDNHHQIKASLNTLTVCRRAIFRLPHQSRSIEGSIRQVQESAVRGDRLRRSLQATAFLMGTHHRLESETSHTYVFVPFADELDGVCLLVQYSRHH